MYAEQELDTQILHGLPQDKWLLASLLQKAIRRGDVAHSTTAAYRLALMDGAYVARRLPIIAYEDVGIANLPLILAIRRSATAVVVMPGKHGAAQAAHLAGALAQSLKSRTACDIASLCEFSPAAKALARTVSGKPLVDLIARASSTDCPLLERAVVLRLLIGIRPEGIAPSSERREARADALRTILSDMRLPALVTEAAMVGTQTEGLNVAIGLAYASMAVSSTVTTATQRRDMLDSPRVGGIPAYVLDMYTRPGQAAFRLLLAHAPELRELLTRYVPRRDHVRCIGFLIFHVEGSLLDRRLSFPAADEILARTETVECEHVGLTDPRGAKQIRRWLHGNSTLLNDARAEALSRARQGERDSPSEA